MHKNMWIANHSTTQYHFPSVNTHLQPTGTCFLQTGSSQPFSLHLVLSLFFSLQGSLCLRYLPCLIFTSFFKDLTQKHSFFIGGFPQRQVASSISELFSI